MDFTEIYDFKEPFRIHIVENIQFNNRQQRTKALKEANYNIFRLNHEDVMVDLLTDSGTNALSLQQNSRVWMGDESYAGASSFEILKEKAKYLTGFTKILPVFSKRIGEQVICHHFVKEGGVVAGNTFTHTLENCIHETKATELSMVTCTNKIFGGNIDMKTLKQYVEDSGKHSIDLVMMNVPSKVLGGLHVSMSNIKQVTSFCKNHSIPVYIETSMYAENCWYIKNNEEGYSNKTMFEIAKEMFSCFDGSIISAKRDGTSEIGCLIGLHSEDMALELSVIITLKAGFVTYGGMAGRNMEVMAAGILEALDESYLLYRVKQVQFFLNLLKKCKVPVIEPIGCNTIFIDAEQALPSMPRESYPAWSLTCAAYISGGIRSAEFGQITRSTTNLPNGHPLNNRDLIKLELPRRTYTTCHYVYVAHVLSQLLTYEKLISGMKIIDSSNDHLRYLKMKLEPLDPTFDAL